MEGFQIPIHNSLTQPILIGGAPREYAIINGTLLLAAVFSLHNFWAVPIGVLIHSIGVYLAKKDPQFLDTFKRHIYLKPYYEA